MARQPSLREATFSRGGGASKMSDPKAPTYEDRCTQPTGQIPVGRAFTVRQPSLSEATFSRGGGPPKMSDPKAPTYEDRCTQPTGQIPVGRAFMVRQPSLREATFSRGGGPPKMSHLKAPTYKDRSHREARCPRRSGLYGPTVILPRSDIFKNCPIIQMC
jgi:hypothetical protein